MKEGGGNLQEKLGNNSHFIFTKEWDHNEIESKKSNRLVSNY